MPESDPHAHLRTSGIRDDLAKRFASEQTSVGPGARTPLDGPDADVRPGQRGPGQHVGHVAPLGLGGLEELAPGRYGLEKVRDLDPRARGAASRPGVLPHPRPDPDLEALCGLVGARAEPQGRHGGDGGQGLAPEAVARNPLQVRVLAQDQIFSAGEQSVTWDGRDDSGQRVSSGIYFYRIRTKDLVLTKKLILTQ